MSSDNNVKEIKDLMIGLSLIEKRTISAEKKAVEEIAKIHTFFNNYKFEMWKHEKATAGRDLHYREEVKKLLNLATKIEAFVQKQNKEQNKKIQSLEEQLKQLRKTTKEQSNVIMEIS